MVKPRSIGARLLVSLAAVAMAVSACSSSGASSAPSAGTPAHRLCLGRRQDLHDRLLEPRRRRERLARGDALLGEGPGRQGRQREQGHVIHRDTDAAGQLADIRDLIAKDVNAIIINPADPAALNPAIKEATAAGILVIAIDASVTAPGAYNLSNDQQQYAYLGASWLFKQLDGQGAVVYMRGIAGHPADTDRDIGFKRALEENPGITIAKETATKWDPATAVTQINDIISSGVEVRRHLDVGHRQRHRRRAQDRQA